MKKVKIFAIFLMMFAILLIIPSVTEAADYIYEDTAQGITWNYEIDSNGSIIDLICRTSSVKGEVTIPSTIDGKTVISLGNVHDNYNWHESAFAENAGITSVTIPNTIVTIGNRAFYGCQGLKTVTMTDSVTKIGDSAFDGCVGLTSITISKNITTIGENAFQNCKGLKAFTIPNGVTNLSNGIFNGCSGLKEITIPENVSSIGSIAFKNCTGLKTITLSKAPLTTIGSWAFANCTGLKSIIIPDTVTTISSHAFEGCSGLKEVKLPEMLTQINERTFKDCSGLTSVIIPNEVTTISGETIFEGAFEGCTNLEKILIPDSVASIGKTVFRECNKLTIYGNDDQESKRFAEDNGIAFDYIANWDKEDTGADITAPTVERILVTYASVMGYNKDANHNFYMVPAGAKLVINVEFSENVKGTIPTLTLKFGEGKNVKVTDGQILGSTITYTYKVKDSDKGIMTAVEYAGGDIKDESGNLAVLSCPKVVIQYNNGDFVYANGTATNPDKGQAGTVDGSGDKTDKEDNKGSGNQSGTNQGTGDKENNKTDTTTKGETLREDNTTALEKLPHAGLKFGIPLAIIVILGVSIVAYFKYYRLRDI